MTRIRGHFVVRWVCGVALVVLMPGLVSAMHVQRLSAVLAPVFLAENFAIVCAARDPAFIDETRGPLGPVAAYSRHMKGEVVSGLSSDEVMAVLRAAADDARRRARETLRSFAGSFDQNRALDLWCATKAKDQVLQIVRLHDGEHDAFTRAIATALRERTREPDHVR
jgi:hypothetical protein